MTIDVSNSKPMGVFVCDKSFDVGNVSKLAQHRFVPNVDHIQVKGALQR